MMANQTSQPEFTLLDLSDFRETQIPFLCLIFLFYWLELVGNLFIIFLVAVDSQLQTPMYFFLGNLSVLDIATSSVAASHLFYDMFTGNRLIAYSTCIAQVFFFTWFVITEFFLLFVMSYDRYVAICHPLHYTSKVSIHLCIQLASSVWVIGSICSLIHTLCILRLSFCDSTTISGFFCDLHQVILLSCSDTTSSCLLTNILMVSTSVAPFVIIFLSYVYILKAILRIKVKEGRQKAFSTCSSHLTLLILFYVTTLFSYIQPKANNLLVGRLVSVAYTFVTPFLNPLIYTLNSQLKDAARRVMVRVFKTERPWGDPREEQNYIHNAEAQVEAPVCLGL